MTDTADPPYLSVVVATRNDDHGRDPVGRLEACLNSLAQQCARSCLSAEAIVVEWNPPADRPPLSEVVRLNPALDFTVRFIHVPPEIHERYRYAEALPLFQMIAKNVGIRRAAGEFVLATNIDIVLSEPLIDYIAARRLRADRLYRVNRHDIERDFPTAADLSVQMAYCREHQLRVHRQCGSFPVHADGSPALAADDIVKTPYVRLGRGWHVTEHGLHSPFRWSGARSEILIAPDAPEECVLSLDVESQPFTSESWLELAAVDGDGNEIARYRVAGRDVVRARVRRGDTLTLCVTDGPCPADVVPPFECRADLWFRVHQIGLTADELRTSHDGWTQLSLTDAKASWSAASVDAIGDGTVLVRTAARQWSYAAELEYIAAESGVHRFELQYRPIVGDVAFGVLPASRKRWLRSEMVRTTASPEWTVTARARLEQGERYYLVLSNDHPDGHLASEVLVTRVRYSFEPPSAPRRRSGLPTAAETLSQRLWSRVSSATPRGLKSAIVDTSERAAALEAQVAQLERANAAFAEVNGGLAPLAPHAAFIRQHRPARLHLNGCGDFQLAARERWHRLRGYPELEMFSMNIDAVFSYLAHYDGVVETVLDEPCCIYHLEHEKGSGWTPEGEAALRRRIAERGVPWLDASVVTTWGCYMEWLGRPLHFNADDWGLGRYTLPETVITPSASLSA